MEGKRGELGWQRLAEPGSRGERYVMSLMVAKWSRQCYVVEQEYRTAVATGVCPERCFSPTRARTVGVSLCCQAPPMLALTLLPAPCGAGGVSMGDRDLIKPLLERNGTIHFGRVRMKPGKPLTFATLELEGGRQMLVFGLPGGYGRGTAVVYTGCPSGIDGVGIVLWCGGLGLGFASG